MCMSFCLSLLTSFLLCVAQASQTNLIEFKWNNEIAISFPKPKGLKGKQRDFEIA